MTKSNIEFLAYEETQLGTLCLRRRELLSQPGTIVTEVTLNHEFLMSSLYTDSERALAQTAIEMHAGDRLSVMVAGLGLGYTAHQALQSDRVARVEVVELLPPVIGWMNDGLIPLSSKLIGNQRLSVIHGDAYQRLWGAPTVTYDLVLIDIDHSPDDRLGDGNNAEFYTTRGLSRAKLHLKANGVLGVWSYAGSSPFVDALHKCFDEVCEVPVTHFNELVQEEHTDWLFFARTRSIS